MKIIRFSSIDDVPASHEDSKNPSVTKRVLLRPGDTKAGNIQMINWATLLPHKSFTSHAHADMQEVFIMMSGGVIAHVDGLEVTLGKGDTLIVDAGENHEMYNPDTVPVEYIAMGIVSPAKTPSGY